MFLRVLCLLTLQCAAGVAVAQAAPVLLRDGQQITITGRLTPEPAGRLQFMAVSTAETYAAVMHYDGADHTGEQTREIGLSDFHSYAALYVHRGEAVTVTGLVKTDPASPYYLHNISVTVQSIRDGHGGNLLPPATVPPRVAVDTRMYQASAVLPADPAAPWQYRVQGGTGLGAGMMTCSSNGGGDVVNCSCADGFHPVRAQSSKGGERTSARIFRDMQMAQFVVGDDAEEVRLSLTCSR